MQQFIKKADIIAAAGGVQAEVARLLGTSRQAVYEWGEWMPELWVRRLPERAPGLYRKLKREGKVHWERPAKRRPRKR